MNTIGTFILVKNEAEYIGYHIMSVLDYVDEMIFADGNSTDGTLEIIEHIKKKYDKNNKIKLFTDMDCKDLQSDYVRLFNWTLGQVKSDYAWFIHPDMICINPEEIRLSLILGAVRYNVNMESIAGEKRDRKIVSGRDKKWATIYRNAYGLHYYGNYGSFEEDCYFSDFTGDTHTFYKKVKYLPYEIKDTKIRLVHFCDCKSYERRYGRMVSCLRNILPGADEADIKNIASNHPRVTLEDGRGFVFVENGCLPPVFEKYRDEFEPLRRS